MAFSPMASRACAGCYERSPVRTSDRTLIDGPRRCCTAGRTGRRRNAPRLQSAAPSGFHRSDSRTIASQGDPALRSTRGAATSSSPTPADEDQRADIGPRATLTRRRGDPLRRAVPVQSCSRFTRATRHVVEVTRWLAAAGATRCCMQRCRSSRERSSTRRVSTRRARPGSGNAAAAFGTNMGLNATLDEVPDHRRRQRRGLGLRQKRSISACRRASIA